MNTFERHWKYSFNYEATFSVQSHQDAYCIWQIILAAISNSQCKGAFGYIVYSSTFFITFFLCVLKKKLNTAISTLASRGK